MTHSEQIGELGAALAKAQAEIRNAMKASDNPYFKSKYADLAAVWDSCRQALASNGLSVVQVPETANGDGQIRVILHTALVHASGQWIAGDLTLVPVKSDPQGIGSAITYARRYALAAMVGVASEDDDGNAASGNDGRGPVATSVERTTQPKTFKRKTEPPKDSSLVDALERSVAAQGKTAEIRATLAEDEPEDFWYGDGRNAAATGQPEAKTGISPDFNECISVDDAQALHIHARSFLPKEMQKHSRQFVHDWCRAKGLVNEKGEGSLLKVKRWYKEPATGQVMSGITRVRTVLEEYMKDMAAAATESK